MRCVKFSFSVHSYHCVLSRRGREDALIEVYSTYSMWTIIKRLVSYLLHIHTCWVRYAMSILQLTAQTECLADCVTGVSLSD